MERFRAAAVGLALALAAGCAPVTPVADDAAEEVQAFADATTRAYRLPGVRVVVKASPGAWLKLRHLAVSPALLDAPLPFRDAAVARLLGFWVIGAPEPRSEAQEEAINATIYPEVNIAAVDVLERVKGLPPDVAATVVHDLLASSADAVAAGTLTVAPRTPHPCAQLAAFVQAFPRYGFGTSPACR